MQLRQYVKTGSTKQDIHVEICSKCHPFYTRTAEGSGSPGRIEKSTKNMACKKRCA